MLNKLDNIKNILSSIICNILSTITSTKGKIFLLVYIILIIITIYIIQVYRNRKLKQQEYESTINNSFRNKAIESFNNYNQQIIQKLTKECNNVIEDPQYDTDKELNDTLIKNGLFYFKIDENYRIYILKNLINKTLSTSQINIIDNILLNLDIELSSIVNKNIQLILDVINNTDNFIKSLNKNIYLDKKNSNEFKYIRIDKLKDLYLNINNLIDDKIILELENDSKTLLKFDDYGLTINETPIPKLIKNELYERFYYKIYLDYKNNNIFKKLCEMKNHIAQQNTDLNNMFQKSYDTDNQKQNDILNLEAEINASKTELIKLQNTYELYLRSLEMFSTSRDTINKLKKTLLTLNNTDIQPANENIIDYLNTYKNNEKSKLYSSPFTLSDTEQERIAESLTTNKLNELNKQYEHELKEKNGDTRLDIVKIFSDAESNVIGFLDNIYKTKSRNNTVRFDNDLSDRGTWLQYTDNNISKNTNSIYYLDENLNKNISTNTKTNTNTNNKKTYNLENKNISTNNTSINNKMINTTSITEGFEDIIESKNINSKSNNNNIQSNTIQDIKNNITDNNIQIPLLEQIVTQFLNVTKNLMDNDTIKNGVKSIFKLLKLDNIKTSEQLGVMLVIVSVLLYFIDLSS